jgi:hypothetical protein
MGERFGNITTETDDEATFIRRARICYGKAKTGYGSFGYGRAKRSYGRTGYGRKIGR